WDWRTGRPAGRPFAAGAAVEELLAGPDGRTLVTLTSDGAVRAWDLAAGREAGRFEVPAGARAAGIALSPCGKALAVAVRFGAAEPWRGQVLLFGAASRRPLARFPAHRDGIRAVWFLPAGRGLLTAGSDPVPDPEADPDCTLKVWQL